VVWDQIFDLGEAVPGRSVAATRFDREFHRTGKYVILVTAEKIYIVIALSQRPINHIRGFSVI
jgi:hypothetical protein